MGGAPLPSGNAAQKIADPVANAAHTGAEGFADSRFPVGSQYANNPGVKFAGMIGGAAPYLAAAALSGPPGWFAGAAASGASTYESVYQDAKAHGASEEQAHEVALVPALVGGGLMSADAQIILRGLPLGIQQGVLRGIVDTAASGGSMVTAAEVGKIVNDYTAQLSYDPSRSAFAHSGEDVGLEALVGGALHAGAAGARMAREGIRNLAAPEADAALRQGAAGINQNAADYNAAQRQAPPPDNAPPAPETPPEPVAPQPPTPQTPPMASSRAEPEPEQISFDHLVPSRQDAEPERDENAAPEPQPAPDVEANTKRDLTSIGKTYPAGQLDPRIEDQVRHEAARKGIDPDWMVALFRAEGGGFDKVSKAGAIGPAQLMPGTAKEVGVDPHDWQQNVAGGVEYFKRQLDRFGGDYGAATAAYNAGPDNAGVKKFAASGDHTALPEETKNYVATIASMAGDRQADRPIVPKVNRVYAGDHSIDTTPQLIELADLIASHDADGRVNPDYPHQEGLQPRDRTTIGSQDQVRDIAAKLNPELLMPSADASGGALIVGPDGKTVENGNGRVAALSLAYNDPVLEQKAVAYKQYLAAQGYDVTGFKQPVLVSRRLTPMEQSQLTDFIKATANRTTLAMTAAERARADADLAGRAIHLWNGAEPSAAANAPFVRAFMQGVPPAERGAMIGPDGTLSNTGERRIQSAVVAHAYGDQLGPTLDKFVNGDAENMKTIANAMSDAAGPWAQMRSEAARGNIPPEADITPDLAHAVQIVDQARQTKKPVSELLAQNDFDRPISPLTDTLVRSFYGDEKLKRGASRDTVADTLKGYVNEAMKAQPGADMFGNKPNPADMLKVALSKRDNGAEKMASKREAAAAQQETAKDPDIKGLPQEAVEARERVRSGLQAMMRFFGLPPDVGLRLTDAIIHEGGKADGSYTPTAKLIELALDTPPNQLASKMFHETVHALMDPKLGLLTHGQRETLRNAADAWLRQGTNRADLARLYGDDPALLREEAIAKLGEEAFKRSLLATTPFGRVYGRMLNAARGIGQALRGQGYRTSDDVFRGLLRGEKAEPGSREALMDAGPSDPYQAAAAAIGQPVSQDKDQEARVEEQPSNLQKAAEVAKSDDKTLESINQFGASPDRYMSLRERRQMGLDFSAKPREENRSEAQPLKSRWHDEGNADLMHEAPATTPRTVYRDALEWTRRYGLKTGKEMLAVVDDKTRQIIQGVTSGRANSVRFGVMKHMAGAEKEYALVHNHPNNSPLSPADIDILVSSRGVRNVAAIGHNGSSIFHAATGYRTNEIGAEQRPNWRGVVQQNYNVFSKLAKQLVAHEFSKGGLTQLQASHHYHDMIARWMHARGLIDYTSTHILSPDLLDAVARHAETFAKPAGSKADDLVQGATKSVLPDAAVASISPGGEEAQPQGYAGNQSARGGTDQGATSPRGDAPAQAPRLPKVDPNGQGRLFAKRDTAPLLSDKEGLERQGQLTIPGTERDTKGALQRQIDAPLSPNGKQRSADDLPLFNRLQQEQPDLFEPHDYREAFAPQGQETTALPESGPKADQAAMALPTPDGESAPKYSLRQNLADAGKAMGEARDKLDHAFSEAFTPFRLGTKAAQATVFKFAQALRSINFRYGVIDRQLMKEYTADERSAMGKALDAESVFQQKVNDGQFADPAAARAAFDASGQGLAGLTPKQQAHVRALDQLARQTWQRLAAVGLVKPGARGLPYYMPRQFVMMDGLTGARRITKADDLLAQRNLFGQTVGGDGASFTAMDRKGENLTTVGPKSRGNLEAADSEAAAAKRFGPNVELVTDIRSLVDALKRQERAIAGRHLVEAIERMGVGSGQQLITQGGTAPDGYFTLEHPALERWVPTSNKDSDGNPIWERQKIHIDEGFGGPLNAVLTKPDPALYRGYMALKNRSMQSIMFSPFMHLMVEVGRSLPIYNMNPGALISSMMRGNKMTKDRAFMDQAIADGLAPIGRGWGQVDASSIMNDATGLPAKSWPAKIWTGDTKLQRGFHAAHQFLLWNQVFNLQAGIYNDMKAKFVDKGFSERAAGVMAAHLANRYAGALPPEHMAAWANKLANLTLFSRSFTLGNAAVIKDLMTGAPAHVRAVIEHDMGATEANRAQSVLRKKAWSSFLLDIGTFYAVNSLAQAGFAALNGGQDNDLPPEAQSEWQKYLHMVLPQLSNEAGKTDRAMIGKDSAGRGTYLRPPLGKVGEEFLGWLPLIGHPGQQSFAKLNPLLRATWESVANEDSHGELVYQPAPQDINEKLGIAGQVVQHIMGSMVPLDYASNLYDLATGKPRGDAGVAAARVVAPFFGAGTISQGAKAGPKQGAIYNQEAHDRFIQTDAKAKATQLYAAGKGDEAQAVLDAAYPDNPRAANEAMKRIVTPEAGLDKRQNRFLNRASPEVQARVNSVNGSNQ